MRDVPVAIEFHERYKAARARLTSLSRYAGGRKVVEHRARSLVASDPDDVGAIRAKRIEEFKALIWDRRDKPKSIRAKEIISFCGALTGFPVTELLGDRRHASVALARHFTAWALCALRTDSLTQVGRAMGRDHTTVLHAKRKISALIEKRALPSDWLDIADLITFRGASA